MSHVRRVLVLVAALALVLVGLVVTTVPASARPRCDVPDPPPICGGGDPVEKLPDLTATVGGPAAAVGGGVATYTVRVANPTGTNAAAARGVAVRIAAAGGTLVAPALSGWTCTGGGSSATCSGGSLSIGAGATFTVSVQLPPAAGQATVSATVDPGNTVAERNESNNSGSLSTTVTSPALPDLQLSMTGPSAVRGVYANGVWTMTVTNRGSVPASPVNVRWLTNWGGTVNANAVKTGAIGFTCTVPPEYLQQVVYCYGTGTLQPGASATIAITAVPPAPGNVYGTAGQSVVTGTVDYGQQVAESDEGNNAATVSSTIQP